LTLDRYYPTLGCIVVCGVGWESYGYSGCSVLALTGVFKFLFHKKNVSFDLVVAFDALACLFD
jgi:hypothetical protein